MKATRATKEPETVKTSLEKSPSPKPAKDEELSYEEFLEDIAIAIALELNSNGGPIPATSLTPSEISKYREDILNKKETRRRFIFQEWPRDPKSNQSLTPENSKMGKMASNGIQIWGATLRDFYTVHRLPSLINLRTHSSGSKLAAWMKSQGEMYAEDLIATAAQEPDPHLIFPCDITPLIKANENLTFEEKSWIRKDPKGKSKETHREHCELPTPVSPRHLLFDRLRAD